MLGENVPLALPPDVVKILNEETLQKIQVGVRPPDVRIVVRPGEAKRFTRPFTASSRWGRNRSLTLKTVDGHFMRALV